MKVRDNPVQARCEFCADDSPNCYPVAFERSGKILVLCDACIGAVRRLLELIDVKEAEG